MLRTRYLLRGVVQGVGFRPHVATVAARHRITGLCGNNDLEVFVEAQALSEDNLDAFISDVLATLPPLAHVVTVTQSSCPPISHETDFRIVASEHIPGARTLIPPDVATCPDCLADMADPNNRRYRYPFTTCTHCGPRLSIIEDLPYDRPLTTMKLFPMCPQCAKEYSDPHDRRYHAQPISCPDCGPSLWVEATETHGRPPLRLRVDDPIAYCRDAISRGKIVAVKGLGGFHLMCDATNDEAVRTLRERKHRPTKPLAVMVPDTDTARELADLDTEAAAALTDPAHPIVLAPTSCKQRKKLSPYIAPDLDYVGLVLPYTPLHTLLVDSPVVATSANNSGEPLCWDNDVARENLTHLADVFLMHDRPIHIPVEDSVVVPSAHGIVPIRRSRGFAPLPLTIPTFAEAGQPALSTLAVGGELKNTFTLAHEDYAHISSHIGDMGSWPSQQAFHRAVDQMLSMQRTPPTCWSAIFIPAMPPPLGHSAIANPTIFRLFRFSIMKPMRWRFLLNTAHVVHQRSFWPQTAPAMGTTIRSGVASFFPIILILDSSARGTSPPLNLLVAIARSSIRGGSQQASRMRGVWTGIVGKNRRFFPTHLRQRSN